MGMIPEQKDLTLPTKFKGDASIILVNTPQKDKIQYRDEAGRIVAQIPLSRMDAEDLGFEEEWKQANKQGKRYYWSIVLIIPEEDGRQ